MKIKNISIKDFRRFTDLTIEGIGPQVKFVILPDNAKVRFESTGPLMKYLDER